MKLLASALGLLITVIGLALVAAPALVLEFGRSLLTPGILYIAAAVRVLFGAVLLWVAPASRAPIPLRGLGALLVVAGVLIPFVGVERSGAVLDWMLAQGPWFTGIWAGAAAVLGAFIAYAVISPRKASA
jgi:hypothetical protein